MIHKIKAMYDEGHGQSIRGIAQALRLSRNTVRKYLKQSVEEINAGLGPAFFRIDVASTIFMLPAEPVVPGSIGQPLQAPSYG